MDPRDARIVLAEARIWAARGLLSPKALQTIEAEYRTDPAEGDGPSIGLSILYALAGILLGAACIAVPVLLHVKDHYVAWWFLGLGGPVLAGGVLLWRLKGPAGVVDALLIGSLVPLTVMALPDESLGRVLAIVSLLVALAVTWLPRPSTTVPVLGSIATFGASGILAYRLVGNFFDDQGAAWLWLGLALAQLVATLFGAHGKSWRTTVATLLCIGVVAPFVLSMDKALPSHDARFYELMVGAFELAILFVGLAMRERGLILGAAIVIAVDAIVYAFETNVLLGIGVLLGVAVLLILLAGSLKRFVRPERA